MDQTEINNDDDDLNAKSDNIANACSVNGTRAFEVDFIKTYEQLPILWDVKHPDYTNNYKRRFASDTLLKIIKKWDCNATRLSVRQKINVLRTCYRKDLRKHLASKTIGLDGQEIYEYIPKNWKFEALKFLGGEVSDEDIVRRNNSIEEVTLDTPNFEVEGNEESENDESLSHTSDILQTYNESKTYKPYTKNQGRKKRKQPKPEVHDYFIDDDTLDREFEAIGSNVVCKLKRMNPEQRCHAELLINKVLLAGLKNNLGDDTDLTEVYK